MDWSGTEGKTEVELKVAVSVAKVHKVYSVQLYLSRIYFYCHSNYLSQEQKCSECSGWLLIDEEE